MQTPSSNTSNHNQPKRKRRKKRRRKRKKHKDIHPVQPIPYAQDINLNMNNNPYLNMYHFNYGYNMNYHCNYYMDYVYVPYPYNYSPGPLHNVPVNNYHVDNNVIYDQVNDKNHHDEIEQVMKLIVAELDLDIDMAQNTKTQIDIDAECKDDMVNVLPNTIESDNPYSIQNFAPNQYQQSMQPSPQQMQPTQTQEISNANAGNPEVADLHYLQNLDVLQTATPRVGANNDRDGVFDTVNVHSLMKQTFADAENSSYRILSPKNQKEHDGNHHKQ